MARIENTKVARPDGVICTRRNIETEVGDHLRVKYPDGTEVEVEDLPVGFMAAEYPPTPPGQIPRWELLKFPFGPLEIVLRFRAPQHVSPEFITLLAKNGEILL